MLSSPLVLDNFLTRRTMGMFLPIFLPPFRTFSVQVCNDVQFLCDDIFYYENKLIAFRDHNPVTKSKALKPYFQYFPNLCNAL